MDAFSDTSSLRGGNNTCVDSISGGWDCGRELRVLREAAARSRTDEAGAMRRSAEELERCVMRRQMDESMALNHFLGSFHESVEQRLERQRALCIGRLEALELRFDSESARLERLRIDIAEEVRRTIDEAVRSIEQSLGAPYHSTKRPAAKDSSEKTGLGLVQVGAELRAATEAAVALGSETSALREELAQETARRCAEAHGLADRMETAAATTASAAATSEDTRNELAQFVASQRPRLEELEAASHEALRVAGEGEAVQVKLQEHMELACTSSQNEHLSLKAEVTRCCDELVSLQDAWRKVPEQTVTEAVAALDGRLLALHRELEGKVEEMEAVALDAETREGKARQNLFFEVQELAAQRAEERRDLVQSTGSYREELRASTEHAERIAAEMDRRLQAEAYELEAHACQRFDSMEASIAGLSGCNDRLIEECRSIARQTEAWRPESANCLADVRDLRHELSRVAKRLQSSSADSTRSIAALSEDCGQLATELACMQRQGTSHEWCVQRCMQRLQYLAMDSPDQAAGVWLDSPGFELSCLGSVALRLYPHGVAGGDGQCAVGLHAAAGVSGARPVPVRVDLGVAGLQRTAQASFEEDGGILWLASGFGSLQALLAGAQDLTVTAEVPPFSWASLSVESKVVREAPSAPRTVAAPAASRPSSAGRMSRRSTGPQPTGSLNNIDGIGSMPPFERLASTAPLCTNRTGWTSFGSADEVATATTLPLAGSTNPFDR